MSMEAIFIQPRHTYAPSEEEGHIHLSAPLITAMAQLHAAGVRGILYRDENFDEERGALSADVLGVNLVGAPYIPRALEIIQRAKPGSTVLLGGQIIDSLGEDFDRLFKTRTDIEVLNGNRLETQQRVFGVLDIPSKEEVSSIPVWEQIGEEHMRAYLSREISFYLSQGCKYKCTFCQAAKNRPEQYRGLEHAIKDLEWLARKALSFGINSLDIYLSNLDLFQDPDQLELFADAVIQMSQTLGFSYRLRGLSTVASIVEAPDSLIEKMKRAGLVAVGFGIDGATPAVWKRTGKVQNLSNDESEAGKCIQAVERAHRFGITPEILMVFGHEAGSMEASRKDLEEALHFSEDMVGQFGAIPRPHVVKTLLPGTEDWKRKKTHGELIERLLTHPELFQALDYTALPSEISHPDPEFRALVEHYYRLVCDLIPGKSTRLTHPNTPEFQRRAQALGTTVEALNEGQYDR